ncbi:unnamed protein product [Lymnaea stagnalis]|uniref:Uncharacterized protein n=1 Tax=Lymnaea stagnalis TaxID=6523 RepID=A0AAV2H1W9_LYMST
MDLQAKIYQRDKDPFTEHPFPKAFYYPSPVKEVNDHVAIYSPERVRESPKREPLEERFFKDNTSFKKSDVSKLHRLDNFIKQNEDENLEHISPIDETLPDSDKSSHFSITKNESQLSSASEEIGRRNTNTNNNISDIVKGLEVLRNKQCLPKHREQMNDRVIKTDSTESVLQRYIERFRNSPPKPREERLKELEATKQEFWWLGSSPASNTSSIAESSQENLRIKQYLQAESKIGQKLTREALLAIDEETLQLQKKADKLLSQSELSLASSGPLVSTEGLGSSASVSDLSITESQPAYRPAFARDQGVYSWPAPRAEVRRDGNSHSDNVKQPSTPADDILARWRLNRKMEKTTLESAAQGRSLGHNVFPQKNIDIDPRLEEFRKKLLTQRALVTTEDIQYERQRMAMLLDDDEEGKQKKGIQIKEISEPAIDPILVRMSRITSNEELIAKSSPRLNPVFSPRTNNTKLVSDTNFNNASNSHSENPADQTYAPGLNINNTASSGRSQEDNANGNSEIDTKISVDHFASQEVCNPASKVYVLRPSEKSSHGLITDDGDTIVNNFGKVEKKLEMQDINPLLDGVNCDPHLKDPGGKIHSLRDSTNLTKSNTDAHRDEKQFEGTKTEQKKKLDAEQINRNIYHQFLEAEKPIAESDDSESKSLLKRQKGKNKKQHSDKGEDFNTKSYSRKEPVNCQRIRHETEGELITLKKKKKQTEMLQKENEISDSGETVFQGELPLSESHQHSHQRKRPEPQLYARSVSSRRINDAKKYNSTGEPGSASLLPSYSKNAVNAAIGQTIVDHIFDGSTVMSSVDSWASMFPQSPAASHSLFDSNLRTPSPVRGQQPLKGPTPLQSTPLGKTASQIIVNDEDNASDCEFEDDSILIILRHQRSQYLKQLEIIEHKLQKIS